MNEIKVNDIMTLVELGKEFVRLTREDISEEMV